MKIAAIDIGTNSVLLLIAEKKPNGSVAPLTDEAIITRIGEGTAETHRFSKAGTERTLAVLKKYKETCDHEGVDRIIAVGTAAFRTAGNRESFIREVRSLLGIKIDVISGAKEAQLIWQSASLEFGNDVFVVDIGGGSTEIMFGPTEMVSLPVGSVMLTEKYVRSDPVCSEDYQMICFLIDKILEGITFEVKKNRPLIATAGTATTLGAIHKKMSVYKHSEIHGMRLSVKAVDEMIENLKSKPLEERKKIPGLEPGRADVILAGSVLLQKIAEKIGAKEITISDRGVRWGLLYEAFQIISPPR